MAILFRELKPYLSRVVRLSICFLDGHYDNYTLLSDIPEGKYDDLYVYGIGMIDVEFPLDVYSEPDKNPPAKMIWADGYFLGCALEIVLTKEPRDDISQRRREDTLLFGDMKGYLQTGRFFSVMEKGKWEPTQYEWRKEIPEEYDEMFVYGIGMEVNLEALKKFRFDVYSAEMAVDTCRTSRMTLVLTKTPREFSA